MQTSENMKIDFTVIDCLDRVNMGKRNAKINGSFSLALLIILGWPAGNPIKNSHNFLRLYHGFQKKEPNRGKGVELCHL